MIYATTATLSTKMLNHSEWHTPTVRHFQATGGAESENLTKNKIFWNVEVSQKSSQVARKHQLRATTNDRSANDVV